MVSVKQMHAWAALAAAALDSSAAAKVSSLDPPSSAFMFGKEEKNKNIRKPLLDQSPDRDSEAEASAEKKLVCKGAADLEAAKEDHLTSKGYQLLRTDPVAAEDFVFLSEIGNGDPWSVLSKWALWAGADTFELKFSRSLRVLKVGDEGPYFKVEDWQAADGSVDENGVRQFDNVMDELRWKRHKRRYEEVTFINFLVFVLGVNLLPEPRVASDTVWHELLRIIVAMRPIPMDEMEPGEVRCRCICALCYRIWQGLWIMLSVINPVLLVYPCTPLLLIISAFLSFMMRIEDSYSLLP